MFDLSIEKIAVLGMLALFILGPERLPAAMSWLGRAVRQAKDYAAEARAHLESPEYAELREPLDQLREPLQQLREPLQQLRTLRDPRSALARHLLDQPGQPPATATPATTTAPSPEPTTDPPSTGTPNPGAPDPAAAGSSTAGVGAPPPIDADAT